MPKEDKKAWKANYLARTLEHLKKFDKCLVVGVDNVGSKQMQEIRAAMRPDAVIVMGKNSLLRRAIRGFLGQKPAFEKLLPLIVQNVGLVFTHSDLSETRKKLLENKRGAPAKAGAIAPCDVKLPPQNTGMGPEKTSFFQALQIPTKIAKGTIEILNEVFLIKEGDKVGASEAALLGMLNIQPFSYGLVVLSVYDNGSVYSPEVLDLSVEVLRAKIVAGARNVAAVSLAIGVPTVASVPHQFANALQNLLAIAANSDVSFKQAEKIKAYLADPSAFAAVAAAPSAGGGTAPTTAEKKEEQKKEEEDSDSDIGMGLFD